MAQVAPPAAPDIAEIRSWFPTLASGFAYLENAGGSQVPIVVADAIRNYFLNNYVQLGAGYPASIRATEVVAQAHDFINTCMNGHGIGKVILGPSSTSLCYMLAECYSNVMPAGSEIILAETGHEANIGPWAKLAERGFNVRFWKVDPESQRCRLEDFDALLNDRTKIVAFPHVSNLLGEIVDVREITRRAHAVGARVVADGVAYAPHRAIDVRAWDVDWYFYSTYKVFGPHMAALFGRSDAIAELRGPNHFFVPQEDIYKFELGGVNHEGCAGLLALRDYYSFLAGQADAHRTERAVVERAFSRMTELEAAPLARMLDYLRSSKSYRIIGTDQPTPSRIPTIGFVHRRMTSPEVVAHVDKSDIGIRYGHMYAYRLCQALGIETATGVVRVSMVHYNTVEEIDRLINLLEMLD